MFTSFSYLELFQRPGITMEAYSPLGNPGRPVKNDTDPVVMEDPVVKEIATKHKATAAQVSQLLQARAGA